jgi:hypothetical protein
MMTLRGLTATNEEAECYVDFLPSSIPDNRSRVLLTYGHYGTDRATLPQYDVFLNDIPVHLGFWNRMDSGMVTQVSITTRFDATKEQAAALLDLGWLPAVRSATRGR